MKLKQTSNSESKCKAPFVRRILSANYVLLVWWPGLINSVIVGCTILDIAKFCSWYSRVNNHVQLAYPIEETKWHTWLPQQIKHRLVDEFLHIPFGHAIPPGQIRLEAFSSRVALVGFSAGISHQHIDWSGRLENEDNCVLEGTEKLHDVCKYMKLAEKIQTKTPWVHLRRIC